MLFLYLMQVFFSTIFSVPSVKLLYLCVLLYFCITLYFMHSKILCVPYITVYFYILCIVILLAQLIACVLLFNFVNLFHSLLVSHRALSLFSLLIKDLLVCDLSLFNEATAELTLLKNFSHN